MTQVRITADPTKHHFTGTLMIHVIAFITAQPGQRDKVLAAFNANVPAVLAEDGSPHMKAYGASVKDLVAGRVIHVLEPARA